MKTEYFYELANFVCKFNKHNLMDLYDEVVLPAFTGEDVWKVKRGKFFFTDVEVVELDNEDERTVAIAGRFVRDTVLRRKQRYDRNTKSLIQDEKTLQSSPSSIFVLILNNHRLIYLKETPHAPTVEMFRETCYTFLSRKTRDHAKQLSDDQKRSFITEYGLPDLRITPFTSEEGLTNFIRQFSVLQTVKITLKTRNNDDIDNADLIDSLHDISESLGSSSTQLSYHNKEEGLDQDKMIEQIKDTTKHTNQLVQLSGLSQENTILKGDNTNFKIVKSITDINLSDIKKAANKLFEKVKDLKANNTIKLPSTEKAVKQKIDMINIDSGS